MRTHSMTGRGRPARRWIAEGFVGLVGLLAVPVAALHAEADPITCPYAFSDLWGMREWTLVSVEVQKTWSFDIAEIFGFGGKTTLMAVSETEDGYRRGVDCARIDA